MDDLLRFQNALSRPSVPVLSHLGAHVELDERKRPRAIAGTDNVVFQLSRHDGGRLALRIPRTANAAAEWAVRYGGLAAYREATMRARFPADPAFLPDAIAVESPSGGIERLPVTVSEWIEGPTLIAAAGRAARAGNGQILRALANAVRDVMNDMRTSGFVHADLTANNLMMRTTGRMAVIDLDRAAWPGSPLGAVGSGSPNYRHPHGVASTPLRDGFAFLVLYASLMALAENPSRWQDDASQGPDAALLLGEWDLGSPDASEVFRQVLRSSGREVTRLFEALRAVIDEGPESVGKHLEVIPGLKPLPQPEPVEHGIGTSLWDVKAAVQRVQKRFDASPPADSALRTPEVPDWGGLAPVEHARPPLPVEDDARELRDLLRVAIQKGNETDVARIWSRLESDPVARTMRLEVEALFARRYAARIEQERRQGQDSVILAIAEEARVRQIPLPANVRAHVREARERLDVRARLDAALAANSRDDLANLAVSGQLVVLGNTDRASLVRVLQAMEWPMLERALNADDDVLILQAYDEELFEEPGNLPQVVKDRVELARARLRWVDQVRAALRQRLYSEVASILDDAPEHAESHLSASERRRVHKIAEQQRAMKQLAVAIQSGDEGNIVAALAVVERVGARLGEHFPWHAIRDVLERVSLIEDIIEAARSRPVDHLKLAQLIPAARAIGLESDSRLSGEFSLEVLQRRVVRAAHLLRLRAAIERGDDSAIVAVAIPDTYGVLEDLEAGERDRIALAYETQYKGRRAFPLAG